MPDSLETLHVAISASGAGLLKQALKVAGRRKEHVLGFPDHLSYGPIDPPDPESRINWMVSELGHERTDWDWLPAEVSAFWARASEPAARMIVWTSSRSASEHAAFLAWVERMEGQTYEVIDLADVEVTRRYNDGRRDRGKALSLGRVWPDVIASEALWDLAQPLKASERLAHLHTWRRLRAENAPLRIIGPGGLKSAPISAFDAALLSYATDQWQPVTRLIGSVMAFETPDYSQVGETVLAARIVHLIATRQLDSRAPVGGGDRYEFGPAGISRETEVQLLQA